MTNAKPAKRGVPQPLQGGPQRFGPYMLEARLAVGGTSEVYLARLVPLGQGDAGSAPPSRDHGPRPDRIIVKRLLPHLIADPEGRTMFEREAALHGAVVHPNVVTVFDSGVTEDGEPFLAMEYVDGCDAFRLLRRATQERTVLPLPVSLYIAREALRGLAAVHAAKNELGVPLGIIHRDLTPSNLYLSREGDVKLGDFGIARSEVRVRGPKTRPGESKPPDAASLLGKFSYLAPEQVSGEPFDHRADLFSMATVLCEMLIGKPLFPGTGQLQVLLAIRDCRLLPLQEARSSLPRGLVPVLEKALSREPRDRFPDAASFSLALSPFVRDVEAAKRELRVRVTSVQNFSSESQLAAVRESARAMRAVRIDSSLTPVAAPGAGRGPVPRAAPGEVKDSLARTTPTAVPVSVVAGPPPLAGPPQASARAPLPAPVRTPAPALPDLEDDDDTNVYPLLESFVIRRTGERLGPWSFTRLVDAMATGVIQRGDLVDYVGRGPMPIEAIADLAGLLPKPKPPAPREPSELEEGAAYVADLAEAALLDVLAHVLVTQQSGKLVVERPGKGGHAPRSREVFFLRGRLHHVRSSDASELLGESLLRRGKLAREELDLALAVLPQYGGRLGETLIALGLVDGVDIFRAIRDQGRDRLTELFLWREGKASLYPDAAVPAVDFPLDLDLPALMLAGLEASHPGDTPLAFLEPRLSAIVAPHRRPELGSVSWPPVVAALLEALKEEVSLRDVVGRVVQSGIASGPDVARALELLLAVDLARWA